MPFVFYCKDRPGAADARRAATADHLSYIESIIDRILVAGPLLDSESESYVGSCFIYDSDNEEEARKLLHDDPYFKAGIYGETECRPFKAAAGTWIGGKTW